MGSMGMIDREEALRRIYDRMIVVRDNASDPKIKQELELLTALLLATILDMGPDSTDCWSAITKETIWESLYH